jgi:hypothetical protein
MKLHRAFGLSALAVYALWATPGLTVERLKEAPGLPYSIDVSDGYRQSCCPSGAKAP